MKQNLIKKKLETLLSDKYPMLKTGEVKRIVKFLIIKGEIKTTTKFQKHSYAGRFSFLYDRPYFNPAHCSIFSGERYFNILERSLYFLLAKIKK